MSTEKTYESLFAPNTYVTAAQFLGEYVVNRKAKSQGIDLPLRFWSRDTPGYSAHWEKELRRQIREANALAKLYSPAAISKALRSKEGRKVLSLGAPWLDDLCKVEQAKLDREAALRAAEPQELVAKQPDPTLPLFSTKKFVHKKSLAQKLREAEGAGGEKEEF